MPQIVLLRGINVGASKRIAMPALRELLSEAGYRDVQTYVQSGNVVLRGDEPDDQLRQRCEELIASRFGFEVPVLVRNRDELARVVRRNPLGEIATNPKRYQVSFLRQEPPPALTEELEQLAKGSERVVTIGREVYAWHPDGVARSKLWSRLADKPLGATSRNWTTVTTLLAMADS